MARVRPARKLAALLGATMAVLLTSLGNSPVTNASDDGPVVTTLELEPTPIAGAQVWLFVVDDDMPEPAVSSEANGKVQIGRLNLDYPTNPVTWQVVASPEDVNGARIADHWHIFAHGFHWIAFAANNDRDSYLLKLDKDFQRKALITVVQNSPTPTNDLFLVAEPDGVTVGVFLPGTGHRLYRFDTHGALRSTTEIGGGLSRHSNGASAILTASGFIVLAPETLNPTATSALKKLEYDLNWTPRRAIFLASEDRTNYAMPSGVLLDTEYLIVNVKVIEGVNSRTAPPTPPLPGTDDSGSLVRLVIAPDGRTVVDRTVLQPSSVVRPHTALIGDRLITTWDGRETGGVIRIDRIELRVDIDIEPGIDPNRFNNNGRGVIPVAIPGQLGG